VSPAGAKNDRIGSNAEALVTGKRVWETSESEPKWAEEELRQSFEELQRTFEGTIAALGVVVEKRDPYITYLKK